MRKLLVLSIMMTLALTASAKSKVSMMDNAAIAPGTATVMDTQQRPQQRRGTAVRRNQPRRPAARGYRQASPPRYRRPAPAPRYRRQAPPQRYRRPGPRPYHRPGPRPYGAPRRGYRR